MKSKIITIFLCLLDNNKIVPNQGLFFLSKAYFMKEALRWSAKEIPINPKNGGR